MELAMVISRPSRIHATARAATIRLWNGVQLSRSTLAGMVLRIVPAVLRAPLELDNDTPRTPSWAMIQGSPQCSAQHTVKPGRPCRGPARPGRGTARNDAQAALRGRVAASLRAPAS